MTSYDQITWSDTDFVRLELSVLVLPDILFIQVSYLHLFLQVASGICCSQYMCSLLVFIYLVKCVQEPRFHAQVYIGWFIRVKVVLPLLFEFYFIQSTGYIISMSFGTTHEPLAVLFFCTMAFTGVTVFTI